MQWLPALFLILPALIAAWAFLRPGFASVALALLVTVPLVLVTAFAFWLQADQRSTGDTIRLILFVGVPAGLITLTTLYALAKGLSHALSGPGDVPRPR